MNKLDRNVLLVIDGQQRLQSFYMGLCGTYKGKTLYYDLMSDHETFDYNFKFEAREEKLPKTNRNSNPERAHIWYPAPLLFTKLRHNNTKLVGKEIIHELGIADPEQCECIRENIKDFSERIFTDKSIGISRVAAHMFGNDAAADRARITELFRRLNDGGTKLSSYDLLASSLKCFDYTMEGFIEKIEAEYSSIGINKDTFIILLLVLNDKPDKSMADMNDDDAIFITEKRIRIENTLETLRKFLDASGHAAWFGDSKKKSMIPLYFITYYIFHLPCDDENVLHIFDNYDVNNTIYNSILTWLKLSLLSHVFSYGCGWRPTIKGMREIHSVMKEHKGGDFPVEELFCLYRKNLHYFFDWNEISPSNFEMLDKEYVLYLMYDRPTQPIRNEDKDHIHPRSILEKRREDPQKIESAGNIQFLDIKTNRKMKRAKEFGNWIKGVKDEGKFIKRHLIPEDRSLWYSKRFDDFLEARIRKIIAKIKSGL